jgi:hypothetical protein
MELRRRCLKIDNDEYMKQCRKTIEGNQEQETEQKFPVS